MKTSCALSFQSRRRARLQDDLLQPYNDDPANWCTVSSPGSGKWLLSDRGRRHARHGHADQRRDVDGLHDGPDVPRGPVVHRSVPARVPSRLLGLDMRLRRVRSARVDVAHDGSTGLSPHDKVSRYAARPRTMLSSKFVPAIGITSRALAAPARSGTPMERGQDPDALFGLAEFAGAGPRRAHAVVCVGSGVARRFKCQHDAADWATTTARAPDRGRSDVA